MKKKYFNIFRVYFFTILLLGIYSSFLYFYNRRSFIEDYNYFLLSGFSGLSTLTFFLSTAVFILSIFLIFLILRKKMPTSLLIIPIYFIFYYFIWSFLITLIVSLSVASFETNLVAIDKLSKLDILFYLLNIILPSYFLYHLHKHKKGGKKNWH